MYQPARLATPLACLSESRRACKSEYMLYNYNFVTINSTRKKNFYSKNYAIMTEEYIDILF